MPHRCGGAVKALLSCCHDFFCIHFIIIRHIGLRMVRDMRLFGGTTHGRTRKPRAECGSCRCMLSVARAIFGGTFFLYLDMHLAREPMPKKCSLCAKDALEFICTWVCDVVCGLWNHLYRLKKSKYFYLNHHTKSILKPSLRYMSFADHFPKRPSVFICIADALHKKYISLIV